MAEATGASRTALAEAAGGVHLPTWEMTAAYVRACDGDVDEWRSRWEKLRGAFGLDKAARSAPPLSPATPGHPVDPPEHRTKRDDPAASRRDDPAASRRDDPSAVVTLHDLATALNMLRKRGGWSYRELDRRARALAQRDGRPPTLPASTLSDTFAAKTLPSREVLTTLLTVCEVTARDIAKWLAARDRVATAHVRKPPDAVRVRESDPRRLGVHSAIRVPNEPEALPGYVPRDLDAELRGSLAEAGARGGFLLLVGASAVGKTRSLYEAVVAVLPDWWLVHPTSPDVIRTLAKAPTPRTVIWLDELQLYLDRRGRTGVQLEDEGFASEIRALVNAGLVIVATLWPHEYGIRAAPRIPDQPDPYADDRDLLGQARVLDVAAELTIDERGRADAMAVADKRIRVALNTSDAGFTQILAAGPQLVRWWENAPDLYTWAVITAAIDAHYLGVRQPLSPRLLANAVPGYLPAAQRAAVPPDWLERALTYATTPLHGAVSALLPVAGPAMGTVDGYLVADYLAQHGQAARNGAPIPDTMWHALRNHLNTAGDLIAVGRAAEERSLFKQARDLFLAASDRQPWQINPDQPARDESELSGLDAGRESQNAGIGGRVPLEIEPMVPPPSEGDDRDLLIFAAARSAWFLNRDDADQTGEPMPDMTSPVDTGRHRAGMAAERRETTVTNPPQRIPGQPLMPESVQRAPNEPPLRAIRDADRPGPAGTSGLDSGRDDSDNPAEAAGG